MVKLNLKGHHLFLQLLQFVLTSVQGLAGEGPVVVRRPHSFTVHHVVVHQALQHVLHSHGSLKQQRERGRYTFTLKFHYPWIFHYYIEFPAELMPFVDLLI